MFGQRLKKLRKELNITQIDFAKALNVSYGAVGNWETGNREPDFATVEKIANYFNVTVDYLLGRTDNKETNDHSVSFDDFTFAFHNETKDLTEEQKQQLLDMAKIFKDALTKDNK